MLTSGVPTDTYAPAFELVVNHIPLPPNIARTIMQVSVTKSLDPPDQFGFRVYDLDLELIDAQSGMFTEGSRVGISVGYGSKKRKMIDGEITALTVDFPNSGPTTVTVDGFCLLHRLTRGTFYRIFEGSTPNSGIPDSEIVSQIAMEMKLTSSVDPTPQRKQPRVQNYRTNLAFIQELAQLNGYALWVDADTLNFKREHAAPNRLQLEHGKTLTSLSLRLSTAGQVKTVEVRGWDQIQKQSFSARAQRSGGTDELAPTGQQQIAQGSGGQSMLVIADASVSSAQEAQAYAERTLSQQKQELTTGNGSCVGHPDVQVGTELELLGIGRFKGIYIVNQVTHTVGRDGYQTTFEVKKKD